jgi:uncharacterized protein YbgA (DUF1722 family)
MDHRQLAEHEIERLDATPPTMAALIEFHASSKLLLMACAEAEMRRLGRVVANADRLPAEAVKHVYREGFVRALAAPPTPGGMVNALLHGFGVVSDALSASERKAFIELIDRCAVSPAAWPEAQRLLHAWAAQHGAAWLEAQSLLRPF